MVWLVLVVLLLLAGGLYFWNERQRRTIRLNDGYGPMLG
jgi:hypothetical protein